MPESTEDRIRPMIQRPVAAALRHLQVSILTIIVCLGVAVRYVDLDRQFTHVDDVGVATSILEQDELYEINYVRKKIYDPTHEGYKSLPYRLLRMLDAESRLESSLPLFKPLMKGIIIPWTWTYAPFQFPITSVLISQDQDYREILFWGRFPSFLFGCFALVLVVVVHRKLNRHDYFLTACSSLLFLSFTWENIIYAKHMSSYGIGVFAAVALLFALINIAEKGSPTTKCSMTLGIVLAIISHMQYQILFFMPAFYLAWLTTENRGLDKKQSTIKPVLIAALTQALLTAPMIMLFLLHRTARGVTWSGAFSFPILFDPSHLSALGDKWAYSFHFFSLNFYKIIEMLFALSPSGGNGFGVNIALIAAMAVGLLRLLKSSSRMERVLGRFFLLSGISIIGIVVLQKLTWGPTRHSLIFLPYMVICVSFGFKTFVEFLSRRMNSETVETICGGAIAAVVLSIFAANLEPSLKERRNLFVESDVKDLIAKYKPDFVVDHATRNLTLMEPLKDWSKRYSPGSRSFTLFKNPVRKNGGVYMLVSVRPVTSLDMIEVGNDFELGADFDYPSTADTIYRRDENTGACVDVCVERRTDAKGMTDKNGIFILVFSKPLSHRSAMGPMRQHAS